MGWWVGRGWPTGFWCQPHPSPLGNIWVFELIGTWLGLGIGGFWTNVMWEGLHNSGFVRTLSRRMECRRVVTEDPREEARE